MLKRYKSLYFNPGINLLVGNNGSGKTEIFKEMFYLPQSAITGPNLADYEYEHEYRPDYDIFLPMSCDFSSSSSHIIWVSETQRATIKKAMSLFGWNIEGDTDDDVVAELGHSVSKIFYLITFLTQHPSSVLLIDHFAESLDTDNIKILMSYLKTLKNQMVLATISRDVMNCIPIDSWNILYKGQVYNSAKYPKIWEDFQMIGLNNYDFFFAKCFLSDQE